MQARHLSLLAALLFVGCSAPEEPPQLGGAKPLEAIQARVSSFGSNMLGWSFNPGMLLLGDGRPASDLRLVAVEGVFPQELVVFAPTLPEVVLRKTLGFWDGLRSCVLGLTSIDGGERGQSLVLVGYANDVPGVLGLDLGARTTSQLGSEPDLYLSEVDGPIEQFEDLDGDGRPEFVASGVRRGDEKKFVFASSVSGAVVARHAAPLLEWPVSSLRRVASRNADLGSGVAFVATERGDELVTSTVGVSWPFSAHAAWTTSFESNHRNGLDVELVSCPDVDGDGVDELLVGADLRAQTPPHFGRVSCVSGRSGALLWSAPVCEADVGRCSRMCLVDDRDFDGLRDVLVARPGAPRGHPLVVLSTRDGRVIGTLAPPGEASDGFALQVDSALCVDESGGQRCFVAVGDDGRGVVWLLELEPPQR
jgi:hypothetical protein